MLFDTIHSLITRKGDTWTQSRAHTKDKCHWKWLKRFNRMLNFLSNKVQYNWHQRQFRIFVLTVGFVHAQGASNHTFQMKWMKAMKKNGGILERKENTMGLIHFFVFFSFIVARNWNILMCIWISFCQWQCTKH